METRHVARHPLFHGPFHGISAQVLRTTAERLALADHVHSVDHVERWEFGQSIGDADHRRDVDRRRYAPRLAAGSPPRIGRRRHARRLPRALRTACHLAADDQ